MWMVALAVVGCTLPDDPAERNQGFAVRPTTCAYAFEKPVVLSGSLPTYATPDTDCVPPEGGDAFTVGFGWPDGVLHLEALRPVAGAVPLRELGLYVRTVDDWCVDWVGEAVIVDLPEWSVSIDGTCADGGLRLVGRIGAQQ
jgi:hypothetical protein